MFQKRPKLLVSSVLALLVLLPSCLRPPDPRVGVKALTADLVFGIPPLDEPVGPPLPDDIEEPVLSQDPDPFDRRIKPPSKFVPKMDCEEADSKQVRYPNANKPSSVPPIGDFRWKNEGFIKSSGISIPLATFEQRSIKDLKIQTSSGGQPKDYTWMTEEREVGTFALVRTYWKVVTSQVVQSPVDSNQEADPGLNGTYITKVEKIKDGETRSFEPNPPVLMLPWGAAADAGRRFGGDDAYVDPTTQETWVLQGTILENRGWDACGEMIDSRFVNGYLRVVTALGSFDYNFDYGIAQPYGGILIGEQVEACDKDFRYVESEEDLKKRCQRDNGVDEDNKPKIEYRSVKAAYIRNIAVIPPDPA